MSVVNGPNMGMKYGYEDKQDGWGDGYNYGQRVADWGLQPSIDVRGPQSQPPTSPAISPGSACIVSASPTGAFAGHPNTIALRTELEGSEHEWIFLTPKDGWEVYAILPPDGSSSQYRRINLRYMQGVWAPSEQVTPTIKQAEGSSDGNASAQDRNTIAIGGDSRAVFPGDIVLGVAADSPLNGRETEGPFFSTRQANVAMGFQAVVHGKGSVALGAESRVYDDEEFVVAIGDVDPSNPSSANILRRLTGLDWGSNPNDAVCLQQMQEMGGVSTLPMQTLGTATRYPDAKLAMVQSLVDANQSWQGSPDQMRSGWVLKGFAYKVAKAHPSITGIMVNLITEGMTPAWGTVVSDMAGGAPIPATEGAEGIFLLDTPMVARTTASLLFCTQEQSVNFPNTADSFIMYITALYDRYEAEWNIPEG